MKQSPKSEIVSFNEAVRDLSTLLEMDGSELDRVVGGMMEASAIASGTTCGTFKGSCSTLTSCETYSFH
jgi:hypothetical protein